jgi:hypothetical protein
MKKILVTIVAVCLLAFTGCNGNLSPLSPRLNNKLQNQNGKIEELKNNQDGVQMELGKLRSDNTIMAEKLNSLQQQQGMFNKANSGVQILQGDGAIIAIIVLAALGMVLIYYYRSEALKAKKTAEMLAHQIASFNDPDLEDQVFTAAINSGVEKEVYHLMVKSQARLGLRRAK